MLRAIGCVVTVLAASGVGLLAYEPGDAVPENFQMPDPLEPEAALESFKVGAGLTLRQVVAEPLVMDPIHLDWGPDGRLWVVEMADYPLGIDGNNTPGGRVRFLSDSDDDGDYDESTVFLDGLSYPTGVKVWRDGVIIVAAPEIIYAEDSDGDGVADIRKTLFRGFREGNQQHRVNGLVWSLDNRLVLANGDSGGSVESVLTGEKVELGGFDLAIDPDSGEMELLTGRTQYGRVRDDAGNWFGCSNSRPLFHFVLPSQVLKRNPHVVYPPSVVQVPEHPFASPVFPASEQALRYNTPFARSRITSACGIAIQRDLRLGEALHGDVFICEPVHNLVHRLELHADGSSYVGRRAEGEAESEILASRDPWCRPVAARTGPDGALWVVDMYRFVIEHPEWIPEEWQKVLDLRAGADRGRIYRLVSDATAKSVVPDDLSGLDPETLVSALASDNGWRRDMVHQMLWWRRDEAEIASALAEASFEDHALARLHLLALRGESAAAEAQADPDSRVRRLALAMAPARDDFTLEEEEDDAQLRLQLAFALGDSHSEKAGAMLAQLAASKKDDPYLTAAIVSSLVPHFDDFMAALDAEKVSPSLRRSLFETAIALGKVSTLSRLLAVDSDAAFGELLAVLDRRKLSFEQFASRAGVQGVALLDDAAVRIDAARAAIEQPTADVRQRVSAVALLGRIPDDRDRDRLRMMARLESAEPEALQLAVVDRLAAMGDHAPLIDVLPQTLPPVQRSIVGHCLENAKSAAVLLTALEQQTLAEATLTAAQRDRLRTFPNGNVSSRAHALFGTADAARVDRVQVVETYQPALELEGDAEAGKLLFAQVCVACHQLDGVGQAIGADLAALTDRSAGALLVGILDPNRAVEDKYLLYTVETTDGGVFVGLLQEETGVGVRLATLDGKSQTVLRTDIVAMESTGRSLMPDGLEAAITHQQMADLIAYVQAAGKGEEGAEKEDGESASERE